jgi:hypothetical protein
VIEGTLVGDTKAVAHATLASEADVALTPTQVATTDVGSITVTVVSI